MPDWGRCPAQSQDASYSAYLSTDKAIYKTINYGKTWFKVLPSGVDRVMAGGGERVVGVSQSKIWIGEYAGTLEEGQSTPPCPKAVEPLAWTQVDVDSAKIQFDPADTYMAVTRYGFPPVPKLEVWLVGKGGAIWHRKPR